MATAIFSPYKGDEGGVTYPRDASFSSYLDTSERDFVRSLAKSINSPSYAREISTPRKSMGRNIYRAQRSGESGVFGAERYFNENIIEKIKGNPLPKNCGDGGDYRRHRHYRRREKRDDLLESGPSSRSNVSTSSSLKSPTPSLKSEGSFHSHFGLLLPKKGSIGHKIISSFQCKGSCFDKKSLFTANTHQLGQSSKNSSQGNKTGSRKTRSSHQEHFAFPIIDTASISLKHDQFHKSVDVFGFHQLGKQELAHNLEKNLSILAWDAIPSTLKTSFPIQLAKKTSASSTIRTYEDEDAYSDVSSDLFEIDHLLGVRGSQTSSPSYEPSEGSIEWSVVSASTTDHLSSCFSDRDEDDYKTAITIERRKVQKSSTSRGIFLGCTNHKAVDVVDNHYIQRP